jgi:hypothetical protein
MATVAGDGGATHILYYRTSADPGWTEGESRDGNGEIPQAGLTDNTWYELQDVCESGGFYSLPSLVKSVYVTSGVSTPTGPIAAPVYHMRVLLSRSATLQAWLGATGGTDDERAASCLGLIHRLLAPAGTARPLCYVTNWTPFSARAEAGGGGFAYEHTGAVLACFEDDVDPDDADDHGDAFDAFSNQVGAVLLEVEALAGSGTYLAVEDFDLIWPPRRAAPEDRAGGRDFFEAGITARWRS